MRTDKVIRKQRWINDVTNFEIGWKKNERQWLLHPYDVITINEHFNHLKRLIKSKPWNNKNDKIYFQLLANIYALICKANQRITIICTVLHDLNKAK